MTPELWSNPRNQEDPLISINKGYRITFNVSFVKKYHLEDSKYCYITKPEKDKSGVKVGFIFDTDNKKFGGTIPSKLNRHTTSNRFQIAPKTWFTSFDIGPDLFIGGYSPIKKTDSKLGDIYWITLEKK